MAKDIEALLYDADLIHDANQLPKEEAENFNSAERVGQMFIDIIEHLRDVSDHNGTPGVGGDVPSGQYGSLISSLWTRSNPGSLAEGETGKILEWNGSAWQYSSTPTGGGGTPGTGGLAWSDLAANDGTLPSTKQIDGSHLLSALSGYLPISELTKQNSKFTWWGQQMQKISNDYVVKGAMINVDSIQFTNGIKLTPESSNGQYYLKLSYAGNGTDTAHFYATGGVSALGMGSVSPGGGGQGVELTGILKHISDNDNNDAEDIAPLVGATVRWAGSQDKWVISKTIISDIAGLSEPSSTGYLKATVSGNNISYSWENITPGTGSINNLSDVGDVTTNPYPTSSTNDTGILAWLTGQHLWGYLKFNVIGTGSGTTKTLSSITFADTTYNVPTYSAATQQAAGLLSSTDKAKLDGIASGANNYSHPTYTAQSSLKLYRISVDNLGHVASTAVADKYDIANILEGHTSVEISITGSAAKLSDSTGPRSVWGQTYWNNGLPQNVQGDLIVEKDTTTNNESIKLSPNTLNVENPKIYMLERNILEYERRKNSVSVDTLAIGFGAEGNNLTHTNIIGKNIELTSTVGNVYIPNASTLAKGLRIGDAVLYWDSQNNSLAVKKYDDSACNFYAFGGVSALGMSSGIGTIPTMTFGSLTVNNDIAVGGSISFGTATIYEDTSEIQIEDTSVNISGYLKVLTGEDNTTGGIWFGNYHLWVNAQGKLVFEGTVLN